MSSTNYNPQYNRTGLGYLTPQKASILFREEMSEYSDCTVEESEFLHLYGSQKESVEARLENSPLDKILCPS